MIRRITTAAGAAAAVALAGCATDSDEFLGQVGDHILDFAIEASAAGGLPGGAMSIEDFVLAAFEPGDDPDAFERATGALGLYEPVVNPFGESTALNIGPLIRNSSQDPRLPVLVASDGAVGEFFGLFSPAFTGPGLYDLFGEVTGLKPNTTYTVALARMSLTVNGELDATEMALNGTVTDPDELQYLGGTEGGRHDVVCNFSVAVGVNAETNPVALGTVTTDPNGEALVDCVPAPVGTSPWWRSDESTEPPGAADSTAAGVNAPAADGGEVRPGQYNYMLLIEGQGTMANPVPDAAPTLRAQLGPDIDAAGTVIDNALAPFPTQLPIEDLLALPVAAGKASALRLRLSQLTTLNGVYKVWLLNDVTGETAPVTGTVTILETDEEGNEVEVSSEAGVGSFNPQPDQIVHFDVDDASTGFSVGDFSHIFVSIEANAGAATPAIAQPFWARYTDLGDDPSDPFGFTFTQSSDASFGSFNLADEPDVFQVQGFGRGAFLGDEVGHSNLFRARFRNLDRPPVGYVMEGFFIDDQGSDASTGVLKAPPEEDFAPLTEVDTNPEVSASVSPVMIIEAADRATLADVGQEFYTYERYIVSLHPKLAADRGPMVILGGELPEALRARAPSAPED